jgi:hypothetical protein
MWWLSPIWGRRLRRSAPEDECAVIRKAHFPGMMIVQTPDGTKMSSKCRVGESVIYAEPVDSGSPTPFSLLAVLKSPEVKEAYLWLKRFKLVRAIKKRTAPFNISIVTASVKITEKKQWDAAGQFRFINKNIEKRYFSFALRKVSREKFTAPRKVSEKKFAPLGIQRGDASRLELTLCCH